jgi:hypothetical protein
MTGEERVDVERIISERRAYEGSKKRDGSARLLTSASYLRANRCRSHPAPINAYAMCRLGGSREWGGVMSGWAEGAWRGADRS